jgi:hypothetical protein
MSAVVLALSEAIRTLSLAEDYLSCEKISSLIDLIAESYAIELDLSDSEPFLESFEILKNALSARPMSDEDERVVKIFAYNLSMFESRYGLDRGALEEKFIDEIEKLMGYEFANLVNIFLKMIKNYDIRNQL